jgi:peptidoglycan/LPS O-acetylase OafA/YrhL
MTNPGHTIPYRLDVQGLRAIAIALVVLAHAHVPGFAGGFVGVDVFFVLSGYLITGLLLREQLLTGAIKYSRFLARRLRRLLPAMLAMLVVILVLATVMLSAYETRMQTGSFVFAATWTSNFFFALSEFDYFAALQGKDLFLHTWSLGVEEQFYVVWPWLVTLSFIFVGTSGDAAKRKKPLLYVLATVFLVSLGLCLHWAEYEPLLGFYMMPARGWQFALGAAVFVSVHDFGGSEPRGQDMLSPRLSSSLLGAAGVLLIIGSAVLLDDNLTYPGFYALAPSVGAALVIHAGRVQGASVLNQVLASKTFVWVGDRSYSLYLWHWPALLLGGAFGITQGAVGIVAIVAVSVLFASISYKAIELPFWKGRYSNATPLRTVFASAAVMLISIGLVYGLQANVFGTPQVAAAEADYNPRLDRPAIYDPGADCDTYYYSADLVPCFEGSNSGKQTAVLLGDSIGAQWVTLLTEIYAPADWQVTVLTKSACAIADVEYYYAPVGGTYEVCTAWREAALAYLAETKPDILFIGSSSHYEFTEAQWTDGVARVLDKVSNVAREVIIIPGTPTLSFDGPSCLESPYRFSFRLSDSQRECEEAMANVGSTAVTAYLESAARGYDNVHVLPLDDLVCPNQRCAAQRSDGLTVFRDNRHLTESFVKALAPDVLERLRQFKVEPT